MREQDLTESEQAQIASILEKHLSGLWESVQNDIEQSVISAKAEFKSNNVELEGAEPANSGYFSAYLLEKLFASLHQEDKKLASTIIYNLKGQAGLLEETNEGGY